MNIAAHSCTKKSQNCFAWLREIGGTRPDCCTAHLKELLFRADELLTEQGIVHWIDFGTLLGAVRHETFIPWDPDIDISILVDESFSFDQLAELFTEAGYYVSQSKQLPDELKVNYSIVNRSHLDIYAYRRSADGIMKMQWGGVSQNWYFPETFLDQMEPVTLYDKQFLAPSPLHDFLSTYRYGPSYHIPIRYCSHLTHLFEPKDYTLSLAKLLQELEPLVVESRKRFAESGVTQRSSFSPSDRSKQQPTWRTHLSHVIAADDRLAYLIRESYELPTRWRPIAQGMLRTYLTVGNRMLNLTRRRYESSLGNEEITLAAYLVLYHIDRLKRALTNVI